MKKLVLIVGVAFFGMSANAQMAEGSHTLEVQLGTSFGGGNSLLSAPGIKYRYFLNENMAIRFGLGYDASTSEDVSAENGDGTGALGTLTMSNSGYYVAPGFEYHFGATERLSPYAGLDLIIGGGSYTEDGANHDGSGYMLDYTSENENKYSSFGVNLLAGFDFYIAKNLFIGAEFGFGWTSMTDKEGTWSVSSGGTTTSGTSPEEKSSSMGIGTNGAVRLGWRF